MAACIARPPLGCARPGVKARRRVVSLAISPGTCGEEAPNGLRLPRRKRPAEVPLQRGVVVDVGKQPSKFDIDKNTEHAAQSSCASSGTRHPGIEREAAEEAMAPTVSSRPENQEKGWKKARAVVKKALGVYVLTEGLGHKAANKLIEGPRWAGGEAAEIDASLVRQCTVASHSGKSVDLNFTFKFVHQISGLALYKDHLKTLDFSSNNIRRIENLDGMKRLRVLKLNACQIARIQNLHDCVSLTELHLQDNFIGQVEGLTHLRFLEYLNLNSNQIIALGRGLAELIKLRELHLDRNQLANLDGLGNLSSLTTLCASGNRLRKVTALQLRGVERLDELQLAGNKLQDLGFLISAASKALTLPRLASLNVSGNLLDGLELRNAPILPCLAELDLSANQIEQLPGELELRWPAAEILDVSGNSLEGPDCLKPLEDLLSLRELAISGNPVVTQAEEGTEQSIAEDAVKHLLKSLPALQYLDGHRLERAPAPQDIEHNKDAAAEELDGDGGDLHGTFRLTQTDLVAELPSVQNSTRQARQHEPSSAVDVKSPIGAAGGLAQGAAVRLLRHRFADEGKVDQWQEQAMKSFAAIEAQIAKTVKKSEADLQDMNDYLQKAERVLQRHRELQENRAAPPCVLDVPLFLQKEIEEDPDHRCTSEERIPAACSRDHKASIRKPTSLVVDATPEELSAPPSEKKFLPAMPPSPFDSWIKGAPQEVETAKITESLDLQKEQSAGFGLKSSPSVQLRQQSRQRCIDFEELRSRAAILTELDEEITALPQDNPAAEVDEEIVQEETLAEASEETVPMQLAEQRLRSVREIRKHFVACQPEVKEKAVRLRMPPPFPALPEWRTEPIMSMGAAPQARKQVRVRVC